MLKIKKKKSPIICTNFHIMLSSDSIFDCVPSFIIFRHNLEGIRKIVLYQTQMVMGALSGVLSGAPLFLEPPCCLSPIGVGVAVNE